MASPHWQRDISDSIADAKNTLSSWDGCMSEAYCKWPVIIAIVIACLIAFSLLWCLFRCLCCGAECCCGCMACCNACCPSSRRKDNQGYQQAPPTPHPYYNQYQPPPHGLTYASGGMGFRGANIPQTATFDAPSKNGGHYNEDALPAMPSWDNATSRRVETHDDVEMEKLEYGRGAQLSNPEVEGYTAQDNLLPKQEAGRYYNAGQQEFSHAGDVGGLTANPYHDSQYHRQVASPSPYPIDRYAATSPYAPTYHSPASEVPYSGANAGYFGGGHSNSYGNGQQRAYEPSVPPSYHTRAPSEIVSPVSPQAQSQYEAYGIVGRKPAPRSWKEV